jgi:hypothetical protein
LENETIMTGYSATVFLLAFTTAIASDAPQPDDQQPSDGPLMGRYQHLMKTESMPDVPPPSPDTQPDLSLLVMEADETGMELECQEREASMTVAGVCTSRWGY